MACLILLQSFEFFLFFQSAEGLVFFTAVITTVKMLLAKWKCCLQPRVQLNKTKGLY